MFVSVGMYVPNIDININTESANMKGERYAIIRDKRKKDKMYVLFLINMNRSLIHSGKLIQKIKTHPCY